MQDVHRAHLQRVSRRREQRERLQGEGCEAAARRRRRGTRGVGCRFLALLHDGGDGGRRGGDPSSCSKLLEGVLGIYPAAWGTARIVCLTSGRRQASVIGGPILGVSIRKRGARKLMRG